MKMKKQIILMIGLSIAILTNCSKYKDYKLPDTIQSNITDKHLNIPGTRLFLVVPDGFKFSQTLPRIENSDNSYIQVMDLVGANYFIDSDKLRKNYYKDRDANILIEKDIIVTKYSGKISVIETKDSEKGKTQSIALAFGDKNFYTMVVGECKLNDTANLNLIINALKTIYYDETKAIFPTENSRFTIDDNVSKLKFAGYTGGVFAYNIGGLNKAYYYPLMTLIQFPPISKNEIKISANKIIQNLTNAGIIEIKQINSNEGKTNGYNSYQGEYIGNWKGKNTLIYLHCVLMDKSFIVMQGVSDNDIENSLIEFKKISNTIKEK